jgi:Fur family ferric uptake transcriptional regulator
MNKELFRIIFKDKKLRLTHPRILVYQELYNAIHPTSPQEIFKSLMKKKRKIGLTSVYCTLTLFASLGIVFKIVIRSNVKYRLCKSEDHHHHIICKGCGDVVEFDFCDLSGCSERVMESTGYQVTEHQLNFYGFCKACQKLV